MKIISYNVNGIRAALKKGLLDWISSADPDILCFQEIKANEDQFDIQLFKDLGYEYNYWFSAQKKGYSGVGVLCKKKPNNIYYGTGINYMDFEGRNIRVDYSNVSVMSLYLPSGTNQDRLSYKFKYMDDFLEYINDLKKTNKNLIICGDFNICHKAIDIHDPIRNANVSGFLPHERQWLTKFLNSGFVDSFRKFNSKPNNYSWWSYRANSRANNKGWRIDYALVSENIESMLTDAFILPDAHHSDHCPVGIKVDF